jgi:hypothetical protein
VTSVSMIVLAKKPADVDEFTEKLEATGTFENVLAANSELTDDGLQRATIRSEYVGNTVEPETSPAAATSEAPAAQPAGEKESPAPAPPTAPARGEKTPPAAATPKAGQPQRGGGRQ